MDAKKADTSKGIKIGGEYYFYQLTYDITNSAILNIPKAGALEQYPWLLPAMICIALGLVGMRNRKRKGSEQDEKEQRKIEFYNAQRSFFSFLLIFGQALKLHAAESV